MTNAQETETFEAIMATLAICQWEITESRACGDTEREDTYLRMADKLDRKRRRYLAKRYPHSFR